MIWQYVYIEIAMIFIMLERIVLRQLTVHQTLIMKQQYI